MKTTRDVAVNTSKVVSYIERAAAEHADFVLFPEGAVSGYWGGFDQAEVEAALTRVSEACARERVAGIVGTSYREKDATYNEVRIYDKSGAFAGSHAKMIPTEKDREWCIPGKELRTFELEGLKFGCLICNDLWVTPGAGPYIDPRLTLQLSRKEAEVIFHSVNSGTRPRARPYHESNLELRAIEGEVYIVVANASAEPEVNCTSGIVSPEGVWIASVNRAGEGFFVEDVAV